MDTGKIGSALLGLGAVVGHFTVADGTPPPYLVWGEDGQAGSVYADGRMEAQAFQGTVDLFTRTEHDPLALRVQTALEEAEAAWRLGSVQYEDGAGLYHYEWVWELG